MFQSSQNEKYSTSYTLACEEQLTRQVVSLSCSALYIVFTLGQLEQQYLLDKSQMINCKFQCILDIIIIMCVWLKIDQNILDKLFADFISS